MAKLRIVDFDVYVRVILEVAGLGRRDVSSRSGRRVASSFLPDAAYGRRGGLDWILTLLVINLADSVVGAGVLVYAGYQLWKKWRK